MKVAPGVQHSFDSMARGICGSCVPSFWNHCVGAAVSSGRPLLRKAAPTTGVIRPQCFNQRSKCGWMSPALVLIVKLSSMSPLATSWCSICQQTTGSS